jgi:hypothetical protein
MRECDACDGRPECREPCGEVQIPLSSIGGLLGFRRAQIVCIIELKARTAPPRSQLYGVPGSGHLILS